MRRCDVRPKIAKRTHPRPSRHDGRPTFARDTHAPHTVVHSSQCVTNLAGQTRILGRRRAGTRRRSNAAAATGFLKSEKPRALRVERRPRRRGASVRATYGWHDATSVANTSHRFTFLNNTWCGDQGPMAGAVGRLRRRRTFRRDADERPAPGRCCGPGTTVAQTTGRNDARPDADDTGDGDGARRRPAEATRARLRRPSVRRPSGHAPRRRWHVVPAESARCRPVTGAQRPGPERPLCKRSPAAAAAHGGDIERLSFSSRFPGGSSRNARGEPCSSSVDRVESHCQCGAFVVG